MAEDRNKASNRAGNRLPKISWYEDRKCWRYRTKVNNKAHTFYVGKGATGPNDELAKGQAIQEALDHREMLETKRELRDLAVSTTGDMEHLKRQTIELHRYFNRPIKKVMESVIVERDLPPLLRTVMLNSLLQEKIETQASRIEELESILAAHGRAATLDATASLAELQDKWIESIRNEKKSSNQTSNHIGSFVTNLRPFIEFLETHAPRIHLTRDLEANWRTVSDYREYIIEEMNEHERSKAWAKGRLDKARLFCEYLSKNGYLSAMPRAIDRHWSRIGVDDPSPTFFSLEEITTLWEAAGDRMKLMMALGLNCGYRAADIRTVERNEINLKQSEILRQRRKKNTAQAHKLWPVTKRLLAAHLKAVPDDRPFTKGFSNISKQITAFIDATIGEENNTDSRRTAKSYRSTGAQQLEHIVLGSAPHLIDQYLAHGDKKLAKHYRKEDLTSLYKALGKLGKRFNLD
ncbi:MAG: hypothetical protein JKX70_01700 [Phycisphaerales bacterium]|nr:hypothetical protein [Phycisphaerales bacterium]